ncbi:MAG: 4-hydroxythreonine-4-phosphate dehydrogenase PdxA [Candidatus Latescibacteria bacterium]|nr:4-hydroxythreonine-4-phosphate dehydrogenase PdxA [Candidatus Latescibacterota bacterium]
MRSILALTMGDVAGVGPEIIAKAVVSGEVESLCVPVVVGDVDHLHRAFEMLGTRRAIWRIEDPSEVRLDEGGVYVIEVPEVDVKGVRIGCVDSRAGDAAVKFVQRATKLAITGRVDGIVTAPLNKEAINVAGYRYAGHTELLADLTGTQSYRMMLVVEGLRAIHVTAHVALRAVFNLLTVERIVETVALSQQAMKSLGVDMPRIAIAGLNPHSGEGGLFGDEEIRIIGPAVERGQALGWNVTGPIPPDTLFYRARRGEFDCVVVMYHDQGHIPLKMAGFDRGVNVTLGLPIVRTSPDHGTAFDIAGKGVARPESMIEAIRVATQLASFRAGAGKYTNS